MEGEGKGKGKGNTKGNGGGEVVAFGNMIAVKNDAKFLVSKAEFTYSDI